MELAALTLFVLISMTSESIFVHTFMAIGIVIIIGLFVEPLLEWLRSRNISL